MAGLSSLDPGVSCSLAVSWLEDSTLIPKSASPRLLWAKFGEGRGDGNGEGNGDDVREQTGDDTCDEVDVDTLSTVYENGTEKQK